MRGLLLWLLAGTMTLSACGGGTSSSSTQIPPTLSGNWQFNMAEQLNPDPNGLSFVGGLQGGFLVQNKGAVAGTATFSFSPAPSALDPDPIVCDSGSAAITGTINGQTVSLTAVANNQTLLTLTGTLSLDGSTMTGSYTSTNGAGCGIVSTQEWSAFLVPPLTGSIQGSFHSAGGAAGLNEQDFLVSGALTQAVNTGASSAIVTGTLNFVNSTTDLSDYPCIAEASVDGYISGNVVVLQIIGAGANGPNIGQIGASVGSGLQPVTLAPTQGGYILHAVAGEGYAVYAAACGGGSLANPADFGIICLGVNSATACPLPITLAPSALSFLSQTVGSPPTTQTVTVTNTSGTTLAGVTLTLTNNGASNFTETDTCGLGGVPSQGGPFNLNSQQSCVVTIGFAPLQNCAAGTLAAQCLTATLTATSPGNDAIFMLPITGGVNASSALTSELDFRTEPGPTGQSGHPAEIRRSSGTCPFQDFEHHAGIDQGTDD
ncbi:MAG: hypothetical protein ACLPVW_06140 [Terriglobales bacterium]